MDPTATSIIQDPPHKRKDFLLLIVALAIVSASFTYVSVNYNHLFALNYTVVAPNVPATTEQVLTYGAQPTFSNIDYFTQVKQNFINQKATFVFADLQAMEVYLYKDGNIEQEFPILTKGKVGSWWETPAGLYKIETKEKNHFSSFGKVNQPWSMSFQGNFFIHGWPTHPDGTPVTSTYSGGCIRLSDEDAKKVYEFASVGTPILIFEKGFATDNKIFSTKTPEVNAEKYLVIDLKSNFAFLEKDSKVATTITAPTNFISALVAAEYINLDRPMPKLSSTASKILLPNTTYTAYQLLFPLLLESSSEADTLLAEHLGHNRFVTLMNKKALSIGMTTSTFSSESGTDQSNTSTAYDLFLLSKYIYNNRSFILNLTAGGKGNNAYEQPQFKNLTQSITFNKDVGFVGGIEDKNTTPSSGVYIFNRTINTETRPIAVILLNSLDTRKDIDVILSYLSTFK